MVLLYLTQHRSWGLNPMRPWFNTLGEVLVFVRSLLQGLVSLHSYRVVHQVLWIFFNINPTLIEDSLGPCLSQHVDEPLFNL